MDENNKLETEEEIKKPEEEPNPENSYSKLYKKRKTLLISSLVIIFLVVILPYLAFNLILNYAKPSNKAPAANISDTKTNSADIDWKTYTNKEIGIVFDYPSTWDPIEKDEELCTTIDGFSRVVNNKTCVGIYLLNSLKSGYFFTAQSKIFPDYMPGRGGSWSDYYSLSYQYNKISPKVFIDSLCSKSKFYSCELKNNNYSFTYVKVLDDEQIIQSTRKANYYYVLSENDTFPILIFSNQSLLDSMSLKDAETILDKMVSSLRVTEVVPYTSTTVTQTPTPTSSQKSCSVDWSNLPSVISAGQTYNIPVTFKSNFGTRLPSVYIAPGGSPLYRAINSDYTQNTVTVTLNINLDTEGNYLLTPYLDEASGKGVKCNAQDITVNP